MSDTLYRVHDRWRATAHAHISCAQANARTAHNEALAQLATRRGGRGGEERRSVARPPKVKSRGGTGRNTGGESPAAIKRKHKIKGKSGARERRLHDWEDGFGVVIWALFWVIFTFVRLSLYSIFEDTYLGFGMLHLMCYQCGWTDGYLN